jgi:hypothetical protein
MMEKVQQPSNSVGSTTDKFNHITFNTTLFKAGGIAAQDVRFSAYA